MKTERFCYKWLPIIMGCHCRADRSFFYKGKQFPVCARCTGILAGMLTGLLLLISPVRPSLAICLLLMLPMIIDGSMQKMLGVKDFAGSEPLSTDRVDAPKESGEASRGYESTNARRFATGLLFGYALMHLIIMFFVSAYGTGFGLGRRLFNK